MIQAGARASTPLRRGLSQDSTAGQGRAPAPGVGGDGSGRHQVKGPCGDATHSRRWWPGRQGDIEEGAKQRRRRVEAPPTGGMRHNTSSSRKIDVHIQKWRRLPTGVLEDSNLEAVELVVVLGIVRVV